MSCYGYWVWTWYHYSCVINVHIITYLISILISDTQSSMVFFFKNFSQCTSTQNISSIYFTTIVFLPIKMYWYKTYNFFFFSHKNDTINYQKNAWCSNTQIRYSLPCMNSDIISFNLTTLYITLVFPTNIMVTVPNILIMKMYKYLHMYVFIFKLEYKFFAYTLITLSLNFYFLIYATWFELQWHSTSLVIITNVVLIFSYNILLF